MGARAAAIMVVVGTVLLVAGGASAQSSSGCTSVLVSLSPCLNYISGNESTAPASCCSQLGKVVQSDPQCLCVALNADPASLGLNVNRTRALGLPDACKVKTPPVSDCAAAAPTAGEAPAPPAASGSTTGAKTTPSTSFENGAGESPRGSAAGFIVAAAVLAVAAV